MHILAKNPNAAKKGNLSSLLQDDGLENPLDRGAWGSTGYGVAESDVTERLTHTYTHTEISCFKRAT